MARIIDGKTISASVYNEIRDELGALEAKGIEPELDVVLVGENPGSMVYVGQKEKKCAELGMRSRTHRLPAETSEADLLALVDQLNRDPSVSGLLVQLPIPAHIDEKKVIEAIDPAKDVDGFHPINMGNLVIDESMLPPCTAKGIMVMLDAIGVDLKGKHAVVVGRSNIVGKPVALMLLREHATVTICHSRTADLPGITRQADVLVAAVGKPNFITGDMVKEGVVVIDVGINRMDDGKLIGDVEFASVEPKAAAITPVPGGVGLMTVALLMKNTITAAKMAAGVG
jgi:methylenetetrahydrofolate dehydrogenase (NADP+) / methenyltetrahydrofolate cyclohydrolase